MLKEEFMKYDKIYLCTDSDLFHELQNMPGKWEKNHANKLQTRLILVPAEQEAKTHLADFDVFFVPYEEIKKWQALYHTYEFADNFVEITEKDTQYGNLSNFIKSGLLSGKEALEALFL